MSGRSQLTRAVIAGLAAYALLLHAFVMSAAATPRAGEAQLLSALQVVCSGQTADRPDFPAPAHTRHVPPCVVCAFGHAALEAPTATVVAPEPETHQEFVFVPRAEPRPSDPKFVTSARPRAPPAFA
ncbi:hypothetical protein [Flaviflagellibacter deserti]|uniref:DUF2946 domain-containing protein n=1 Tax=Flaviflagellibacter deserti TaxID=2267266 RepID=A0ABV9YZQ7_9HYPH